MVSPARIIVYASSKYSSPTVMSSYMQVKVFIYSMSADEWWMNSFQHFNTFSSHFYSCSLTRKDTFQREKKNKLRKILKNEKERYERIFHIERGRENSNTKTNSKKERKIEEERELKNQRQSLGRMKKEGGGRGKMNICVREGVKL